MLSSDRAGIGGQVVAEAMLEGSLNEALVATRRGLLDLPRP